MAYIDQASSLPKHSSRQSPSVCRDRDLPTLCNFVGSLVRLFCPAALQTHVGAVFDEDQVATDFDDTHVNPFANQLACADDGDYITTELGFA